MKRLLALDGGGIRGIFSLEILSRLQTLLRAREQKPDLVLADYFDFIAGTSTGGIIATCLSWGMSVEDIQTLYLERAVEMFRPAPFYRRFWTKFEAEAITRMFKTVFSEDEAGEIPAMLDTKKLRTLLVLVMRNHTTGSPWPVSNNPAAKFNDRSLPDCNFKIPLWQLIRASTAAPTFFPPETIELGGRKHVFVDGGITPYNNPAFLVYAMATLPGYNLNWPTGVDQMLLVSIGTGRVRTGIGALRGDQLNLLVHAKSLPTALMESISSQQDMICRVLGDCLTGPPIDVELGDLRTKDPKLKEEKKFTYVRYDHIFTEKEISDARTRTKTDFTLDNLALIPVLREIGARYASARVSAEHLR